MKISKISFVTEMLTKVRVVSLVKEELVAHSLHDDVPGVD